MAAKVEPFATNTDSIPSVVSIKDAPNEFKEALLKELGYATDGTYVLDGSGERVKDPYLKVEVTLDRMLIMPGSVIILDDNPASIGAYLLDHPES